MRPFSTGCLTSPKVSTLLLLVRPRKAHDVLSVILRSPGDEILVLVDQDEVLLVLKDRRDIEAVSLGEVRGGRCDHASI